MSADTAGTRRDGQHTAAANSNSATGQPHAPHNAHQPHALHAPQSPHAPHQAHQQADPPQVGSGLTSTSTVYYTAQESAKTPEQDILGHGTPEQALLGLSGTPEQALLGLSGTPEQALLGLAEVQEQDALEHTPPYIPSPQNYQTFGKSTLRQSVIYRQSTRLFPSNDRVINNMEEQMVRFRVGASDYTNTLQAVSGKHPYQSDDLPVLQVVTATGTSSETRAGTKPESGTGTGTSTTHTASSDYASATTTDSMVDSIVQSPYLNIDEAYIRNDVKSRIHRGLSIRTFQENNDVLLQTIAETEEDVLPETDLNDNSPSFTDSIRQSLENSHNNGLVTPAVPLTSEELTQLTVRNKQYPPMPAADPAVITCADNSSYLNSLNRNYGLQQYQEEEDLSCWEMFCETLQDMWQDVVDIFTCNLDFEEEIRNYRLTI